MGVKPGKKVTLKDIAEALGVATSTVSNAYNRPDQLSPELRERVFATARELGYSGPDPMARGLRRGRVGAIGVVYPDRLSYAFTDPVAPLFIQGIALEAEQAGYGLLLVGTAPDQSLTLAATASVDGFVVQCFADGDPLYKAVVGRRLPTVLVDNFRAAPGFPFVTVDDVGGARTAAEHLLGLGHRRLGVVSLQLAHDSTGGFLSPLQQSRASYGPTRARLQGYRAALEAAGLSWERDVAVFECPDNTPEAGREAAEALLRLEPRPTAVLAMSDQLALGVLGYAAQQGVAVPRELSVVGYDDAPAAARTSPPLTTVRQDHVEKGRRAGQMLIAHLEGREPPEPVVLPTRLVVRESSGPPPRA